MRSFFGVGPTYTADEAHIAMHRAAPARFSSSAGGRLLVLGYPCKSMSGKNNAAASFRDRNSTTGSGLASLISYVDYCGPELEVILFASR